ncbi:hypothetical protein ACLOJK_041381 [Asimina triloba]
MEVSPGVKEVKSLEGGVAPMMYALSMEEDIALANLGKRKKITAEPMEVEGEEPISSPEERKKKEERYEPYYRLH